MTCPYCHLSGCGGGCQWYAEDQARRRREMDAWFEQQRQDQEAAEAARRRKEAREAEEAMRQHQELVQQWTRELKEQERLESLRMQADRVCPKCKAFGDFSFLCPFCGGVTENHDAYVQRRREAEAEREARALERARVRIAEEKAQQAWEKEEQRLAEEKMRAREAITAPIRDVLQAVIWPLLSLFFPFRGESAILNLPRIWVCGTCC